MSSKPFPGFPARMYFTPLPNLFFSQLSPQIDSLAELKVILHIFWLLYQKKGYPKFVTYRELLGDKTLMKGIAKDQEPAAEVLHQALDRAVNRGILLHLAVNKGEQQEELYYINTEADRRAMTKMETGEIPLGEPLAESEPPLEEKPNIFVLFEQNIGLLTPLIAEQLKEAEKSYPASWIEDAFRLAVSSNKRSWAYISRILERWSVEGKDSGKPRRYTKKKRVQYYEYFQGKYGHVAKR